MLHVQRLSAAGTKLSEMGGSCGSLVALLRTRSWDGVLSTYTSAGGTNARYRCTAALAPQVSF